MGLKPEQEHRQRDSVTMKVIGGFFAFFSLLVLLGTFWEHRTHAVIVNIVAGLALLAIGGGMVAYGMLLARHPK